MKPISKYDKIILASNSPRRSHLLEQTGLKFTVLRGEVDEDFPEGMGPEEVAAFLSEKKSEHFSYAIDGPGTLLITADTIVWLMGQILGKPSGYKQAYEMLEKLSGKKHTVITGVTLRSLEKLSTFTCSTNVYFRTLSREEIIHYLDEFKPYDKAGAYGIQDWIGHIGVERIEGSYFNVMGLPVQKLYRELLNF